MPRWWDLRDGSSRAVRPYGRGSPLRPSSATRHKQPSVIKLTVQTRQAASGTRYASRRRDRGVAAGGGDAAEGILWLQAADADIADEDQTRQPATGELQPSETRIEWVDSRGGFTKVTSGSDPGAARLDEHHERSLKACRDERAAKRGGGAPPSPASPTSSIFSNPISSSKMRSKSSGRVTSASYDSRRSSAMRLAFAYELHGCGSSTKRPRGRRHSKTRANQSRMPLSP